MTETNDERAVLRLSRDGFYYRSMAETLWFGVASVVAAVAVAIVWLSAGAGWLWIPLAVLVIVASQAYAAYETGRGYARGMFEMYVAAYPDREEPEIEFVEKG